MAFLKEDETFTCCLSSLNVARYDEWKGNDLFIQDCVYFLNGVLNEFIEKSKSIVGFEKAHNFAKRHRSIGLGQLGLHTYLQERNLPYVSLGHKILAEQLGKFIYTNAVKASSDLALIYGEPEVMKGTGRYNSQLIAIAPTKGNSEYSGGVSEGINVIESNCYKGQGAKISSVFKNPTLVKVLKDKYNISTDNKELYNQV
jgi:ribonucleoside-diphosphate reductase alpha chain